jgi:sugar O-acyltransferase (sialic acid O-acetyltransferase NeuD family)
MSEPLRRLAIVGAGGLARELAWLVSEINRTESTYEFIGYIVSDLSYVGERDSRPQILGDYSWIEDNLQNVDALAIGIGTPSARKQAATELQRRFPNLEWPALIHPLVHFDRSSCQLGRGVVLCVGVMGTVNLLLEDFSFVNGICTLGHESRIRRYAVLNPSVNISGGVDVGEEVLIGTGAQILQYLKIGDKAVIGAGAVVTKDVAAGETVVGIPARPMARHQVSGR